MTRANFSNVALRDDLAEKTEDSPVSHVQSDFRPTMMGVEMDEGFTCGDCGLKAECEELLHGSLDAYDDDPDTFCPRCYSDFIIPHKPKEDAD